MLNTRLISHSRGAMKILEVVSASYYIFILFFYTFQCHLLNLDQQVLAIICIILWRHFDLSFGGDAQAGKDRYMGNNQELIESNNNIF